MEARNAFAIKYGNPGERIDIETWLNWLGIWLSGWNEALEQDDELRLVTNMIRAKNRRAMRSVGEPKWSLVKGEVSNPLSYTPDGFWVKFPNGVEFPLEAIMDKDDFEIVIDRGECIEAGDIGESIYDE